MTQQDDEQYYYVNNDERTQLYTVKPNRVIVFHT